MKIDDMVTKLILGMYSMYEKWVQIPYSSINNSKINSKYVKPIDSMGQIWTAYFLCTRITLETTALRIKFKNKKKNVHGPNPLITPYSAHIL